MPRATIGSVNTQPLYPSPLHRVSDRYASIAPSATLAVDAKAKAMKAEGRPIIGYGAGEPDFPTPENVVEAALRATKDPSSYRYTPTAGLPALRQAIANSTGMFGAEATQPNQVLVTNGGKQAVFQACGALINAGDEVLLPSPYWTTYPETIKLAGGVPVTVPATYEQGYKVTVEQLEAARTDRTIALLFCSPSNPTGAVYSEYEVKAIGDWALDHGIWIISDEIYDHLVYGGATATSFLSVVPELARQTVVLNGVAKTYAMTGWRVGWMVGPQDVIGAASSFQSHATSNVNNIAQKAALEALTGPQNTVEEMREAFDRRRLLMVEMLREIPGFEVPLPQGAFYAFPRVTEVFGRTVGGQVIESSAQLADVLLEQAEVALVPGEAFGAPGHVRLSYALGDEDLVIGLERMQRLLG